MSSGLDADWSRVAARCIGSMTGVADPHEGALEGPEIGVDGEVGALGVPERYARWLTERTGMPLCVTLPVMTVMISASIQGGLVCRVPLPKGRWLIVPVVVQYIGLARSGSGKSTLLDEVKPLIEHAMWQALEIRLDYIEAQRQAVMKTLSAPGMDIWERIWAAGVCPETFSPNATAESLRNRLADNGGHLLAWSAEPQILGDLGRYQENGRKDASPPIENFLHGFDQADLHVGRVGAGLISIPQLSLPAVILLQPDSFRMVASNQEVLSRGFLSRFWMAEAESVDPGPDFDLGDLEDWQAEAVRGAALSDSFGQVCAALASRTALYRGHKGIRRAWERERENRVAVPGAGQGGPGEPARAVRESLSLGPAATAEYIAVQRVMQRVKRAITVLEAEAGGGESPYRPLADRLVSHVLRWATCTALAADPMRVDVPGWAIRDAGMRILPWLWGHWAAVLDPAQEETGRARIAEDLIRNPKQLDNSPEALLIKAMGRLTQAKIGGGGGGGAGADGAGPVLTRSAVVDDVYDRLSSARRVKGIRGQLMRVLDRMAVESHDVQAAGTTVNAGGRSFPLVRLSPLGMEKLKAETSFFG